MSVSFFGKLKLSCDVIVVSHFSHQVIVFEWKYINKNNHLIGKLPKTITSHDSFQSPNFIGNSRACCAGWGPRAARPPGGESGVWKSHVFSLSHNSYFLLSLWFYYVFFYFLFLFSLFLFVIAVILCIFRCFLFVSFSFVWCIGSESPEPD